MNILKGYSLIAAVTSLLLLTACNDSDNNNPPKENDPADIRSLSVDSDGKLWVSIADLVNPRVVVVDTMSDNITHTVTTTFNPSEVVFAEKPANNLEYAIINTIAPDYTDSDLVLVDISTSSFSKSSGNHQTGFSDYAVAAHGEYFYQIGRNNLDIVKQYSVSTPTSTNYSYSTLDDVNDPTSNPYTMVFVDNNKAFLIRYASDKLWVVNPSAASEANFKLAEIDLSAYNYPTASDVPKMSSGIIVDGKLYLAMERLNGYTAVAGESYVAVIDVNTYQEVDTRTAGSSASLKGIQLKTANPQKLVYQEDAGLFVQSIGKWSGSDPADYIGGVEKIDTTDYSTSYVIDDDSTTARISNLEIINETLGYVVIYYAWGSTALFSFDPSTGTIDDSPILGKKP